MKDVNNDMYFIDLVLKRNKSSAVEDEKKYKKNIFKVMMKGEHVSDYK